MNHSFIIESHRRDYQRQIIIVSHDTDEWRIAFGNTEASFWDIVGDTLMSQTLARLNSGEKRETEMVFLLPDRSEKEGKFYSRKLIYDISEKAVCHLVMVLPDHYDVIKVWDKEERWITNHMEEHVYLPTLAEYKRQLDAKKEDMEVTQEPQEPVEGKPKQELSISPFSNEKNAQISAKAHQNAMRFAHPVDQSIIRVLHNPVVNAVFNKVVQTSIDANYGLILASGIHVSQDTYSEVYDIVRKCADRLGIPVPYVIISDAVKGINACTAGTDQFSFIAISSFLPIVMSPDELSFVIGHECGHLALGHVVYHTALAMVGAAGGLLPLVGAGIEKIMKYPLNAWSRRSEISADRAGLLCCGDIKTAKRALFKLEAGLLNADNVDIDGYVREAEEILDNTALGKLSEYNLSHPIIPKRIKALDYFARSEMYHDMTGKACEPETGLLSDKDMEEQIEQIIEIM